MSLQLETEDKVSDGEKQSLSVDAGPDDKKKDAGAHQAVPVQYDLAEKDAVKNKVASQGVLTQYDKD